MTTTMMMMMTTGWIMRHHYYRWVSPRQLRSIPAKTRRFSGSSDCSSSRSTSPYPARRCSRWRYPPPSHWQPLRKEYNPIPREWTGKTSHRKRACLWISRTLRCLHLRAGRLCEPTWTAPQPPGRWSARRGGRTALSTGPLWISDAWAAPAAESRTASPKKKKAHYSNTDEGVPLLRPDLLLSVSVDCFVGEIQPTPLTTYNWSGQVRSLKIGRLSNKTASQHELYSLT